MGDKSPFGEGKDNSNDAKTGRGVEALFNRIEEAPASQKSNEGSIKNDTQLASSFEKSLGDLNSGNKFQADKGFGQFSKDLKETLKNAYETGGRDQVDKTLTSVDRKISVPNTGILNLGRGDKMEIYAIRPVDPKVSEMLDKTGAPANNSFVQLPDAQGKMAWYETLAKVDVDLKQLDQKAESKKSFEKKTGFSVEEVGQQAAKEILADVKNFNGKGISEQLVKTLNDLTTKAAPALEQEINKALAGSGYSVNLDYQYGLK